MAVDLGLDRRQLSLQRSDRSGDRCLHHINGSGLAPATLVMQKPIELPSPRDQGSQRDVSRRPNLSCPSLSRSRPKSRSSRQSIASVLALIPLATLNAFTRRECTTAHRIPAAASCASNRRSYPPLRSNMTMSCSASRPPTNRAISTASLLCRRTALTPSRATSKNRLPISTPISLSLLSFIPTSVMLDGSGPST